MHVVWLRYRLNQFSIWYHFQTKTKVPEGGGGWGGGGGGKVYAHYLELYIATTKIVLS